MCENETRGRKATDEVSGISQITLWKAGEFSSAAEQQEPV